MMILGILVLVVILIAMFVIANFINSNRAEPLCSVRVPQARSSPISKPKTVEPKIEPKKPPTILKSFCQFQEWIEKQAHYNIEKFKACEQLFITLDNGHPSGESYEIDIWTMEPEFNCGVWTEPSKMDKTVLEPQNGCLAGWVYVPHEEVIFDFDFKYEDAIFEATR